MKDVYTQAQATEKMSTETPASNFLTWLEAGRRAVDAALSAALKKHPGADSPHSCIAQAVRYSVEVGGKRVRPILVLEACRLCGGDPAAAMPAAMAIELVHTFSLIHDDLPAMDNDDLRRGQPTNHKVFGEALAILAGDWLLAEALRLAIDADVDARTARELVRLLVDGAERMIDGQAADIAGEHRPPERERVTYIHLHKTAALIETSCRLGAACARATAAQAEAIAAYGRHLGLAFQITDDLLDQTATDIQLGKRTCKDAAIEKQTYPAAFGVDEARRQARVEVDAAIAALESFGARADRLREMARFVIQRDH
jgi:geranylgeranyl diphosphate synthase type II